MLGVLIKFILLDVAGSLGIKITCSKNPKTLKFNILDYTFIQIDMNLALNPGI